MIHHPPYTAAETGVVPPATILVTGGTGFVGSYVIRDLLQAGYTVRAIRRHNNLPSHIDASLLAGVDWIHCDVLDPVGLEEAMEGVDAVVHAAAVVSFLKKERATMLAVNTEGTANTVNAAIAKGVRKFIHVSSVAALGRVANGTLVNENSKWENSRLNTAYALSKFRAEIEVWRGIAEGLNGVIVNPSTVIGYGDWHTTSCAIFKSVYKGFPWYTRGVNGFVDVENVSEAIVRLLQSDIHSERFILNGGNWSYQQLLNTIAEGFAVKKPYHHAGPFLGGVAWRMEKLRSFFTGKKPLLTRETAKVARSNTRFDNTRILQALPGFRFRPLEQSIQATCALYREQIAKRSVS